MTKYIPVVKNNNESLKYLMDKLHMGLNMALQPFDIKQVTNVGFHIEMIGGRPQDSQKGGCGFCE